MIIVILIALILFADIPQTDETVRAYGAADREWQLVEMNGTTPTAKVTLLFHEAGQLSGQAPCNSYSAAMTVPYPWFIVDAIAATRRMCPDHGVEIAYFNALSRATLSEVFGDTLILSDDERVLLVFKAAG
jgi:heat shock protein HslJ